MRTADVAPPVWTSARQKHSRRHSNWMQGAAFPT
ncbi:hypothetical protein RB2654_15375 [Rhodobacterales bacterium HTCC2654]|uniref:Uncharacterized protein n=1 Tax=Maritimibacter alkaliphilus HTCC2654 TaxID=314271 RepID=A3VHC4_9RHOB|nr:hypothetical protein RB2654_15375 [Rhodobacterales bacterium HTCC2654] [Maritimibacter alkaliphilus HTCC2654]